MIVHPSSRSRTRLGVSALSAALLAGVATAGAAPSMAADSGPAVPPTSSAETGWVMSTLHRMTLEEKVGQLFATRVYGETADTTDPAMVSINRSFLGVDNAAQAVARYHLGGIIYFAYAGNTRSPQQVAELSNGIQRAAGDEHLGVPVLVSTDQEQGAVVRLGPPATQFPGNMALAAGRSVADAGTAARITGQELRAVGINQDLAPVSDVNINPANPVIGVRSFGEDPALAAEMVAAQVTNYQEAGVAATLKHFPGHGDTAVDSHSGLPVISHSREEWERIDLPPFKAAIARGVDAVMTAHIVVPALDPSGDPATLSRPILTGLLRDELGYDGVVITDSLGMAGVRQKYGDDRVPVLALKAGVDMLLNPPVMQVAYDAVLAAVRNGELTERRIDESVARVLRLKWHRGIVHSPYVDTAAVAGTVGTPDHLAAAQEITDRTTTLLRDDADTLPLVPQERVLVTGWDDPATPTTTAALGRALNDRGLAVDVLSTGEKPTQKRIDAARAAARAHPVTVVVTNRATTDTGQQRLVRALLATGTRLVVVAVRDPYDVSSFPGVPTYLATYVFNDVAMSSLAAVLTGAIQPGGRLPVTIPDPAHPGTALFPFGAGLTTT
ncbi:glycoside hydrolase family 3 N-terminal domain-containing protein [Micromonospora halotolerans]|uniref:beta-N-acetylhexosaminidase n=1 Tax=Micromonospora halotolerans TaxID=709879 RepID=A0ABY9ZWV3_9ACTN|nr:glycoside hydrolase family 3 N-terminal domain-containing protein [Micromonospora halotolerans]WNM39060.1 glycoside hydrolase family 3 N-terminal domain-containing protein [Micromonospora halotolerans]